MAVIVVVGHHQLPPRSVGVRGVGLPYPLQNGASAAGVGHHVVVGGLGGVVEVIAGGDLHRLLHAVRVIQDQPQQRGRGHVRPVRLLVRGHGVPALVGHVDAAGHAGVIDAVQRDVGHGQAGDPVGQTLHVLLHVQAQKLEVHGGDGGVTALVGMGADNAGVCLGEVVVPGKEPVPLRGLRGKGGAGNLRLADAHGNQSLGDIAGDEGDQLRVAGGPALGHKLVQVEPALHVHDVYGPVQMAVVPLPEELHAGQGQYLVVPQGKNCDHQYQQQRQNCRQSAQQNFLPPLLGLYRVFHRDFLTFQMIYRRNRCSSLPYSFF